MARAPVLEDPCTLAVPPVERGPNELKHAFN